MAPATPMPSSGRPTRAGARRTRRLLARASFLAFALPLAAPAQNLIWENQGMTNALGITSGRVFSYNGADVTLTWSTNGTGLTFGDYGSNFVTYQSGMEGGHVGHVLLGFDAPSEETSGPNRFLTFTLTFSTVQSNLAFSILDIDQGSWDDAVEIIYNGNQNVASNSALWSYANANASFRTVSTDNESYYVGWEGTRSNSATNQNYGNLNLNLSGIGITSIRIRYWCADDGDSNPGAQKIGISDLYVVPEPPALAAAALTLLLLAAARRRLKAHSL